MQKNFFHRKINGLLSSKINFYDTLLILVIVSILFWVSGALYAFSFSSSIFLILFSVLFGSYMLVKSYSKNKLWDKGFFIGIYFSFSTIPTTFSNKVGKKNIKNPILTKKDVSDVKADFVADPFLIKERNMYYLFFEVFNSKTKKGEIGLATSINGISWNYDRIILEEKFHLSYPHVFKSSNEFYMIPETHKAEEVRLYKAINFPYLWKPVKTILKGKSFMDSTIFYFDKYWWIFTETNNNKELRLYYSKDLFGKWEEHPKSPLIKNNPHIARPAGNVVIFGKKIIRYAQDDFPSYGNQVWAFEITKLTTKEYAERKINNKPILKGFEIWNKRGMHHISLVRLMKNKWIAAVDGY